LVPLPSPLGDLIFRLNAQRESTKRAPEDALSSKLGEMPERAPNPLGRLLCARVAMCFHHGRPLSRSRNAAAPTITNPTITPAIVLTLGDAGDHERRKRLGAGGEPAPRWTAARPTPHLRSAAHSSDSVLICARGQEVGAARILSFGRRRIPGSYQREQQDIARPPA
jgi:hypothetical protein